MNIYKCCRFTEVKKSRSHLCCLKYFDALKLMSLQRKLGLCKQSGSDLVLRVGGGNPNWGTTGGEEKGMVVGLQRKGEVAKACITNGCLLSKLIGFNPIVRGKSKNYLYHLVTTYRKFQNLIKTLFTVSLKTQR